MFFSRMTDGSGETTGSAVVMMPTVWAILLGVSDFFISLIFLGLQSADSVV